VAPRRARAGNSTELSEPGRIEHRANDFGQPRGSASETDTASRRGPSGWLGITYGWARRLLNAVADSDGEFADWRT